MSRQRILIGVFIFGLLVVAGFAIWQPSYWSDLLTGSNDDAAPVTAAGARTAHTPGTRRAAADTPPTLLRELPRQALLITAAHRFARPVSDRSVDFAGPERGPQLECRQAFDWGKRTVRVTVRDAAGKELRAFELPVPMLEKNYPDYAKLAASVEPWCDAHFAPLFAATASSAPAPPPPLGADAAAPPEVEALLGQIDPQSAFLAAALLHEQVAASGESPQRLAALVRAYGHLGDATRYLYSPHGSAFFARALIYAERLARQHPGLPLSHAARGYAYALLGQPMDARRALARARELAGAGELPTWAALADDLAHFRTRQLFDRVDGGPAAPLAAYFAALSVEHSGMQSVVINTSRLALRHNPGALRVINIMNDNSGVSLQHETTAQSSAVQFALLAKLADEPRAPESVRSAAAEAKKRSFAAPALLELLATMDAEPPPPGQLMPWSAYASISRDALFVSGFGRLFFTDKVLGADVQNRLKAWWPILKDHRFAPTLLGFDRAGELGGGGNNKDALAAIRRVSADDIYKRNTWMIDYVKRLPAPTTGTQLQLPPRWIENYEYDSDDTVYDVAHLLWTYKGPEADALPVLSIIKGEVAKSLAIMCPDHPSALAELIVNKWTETRPRAAQIERDMGSHPQVAYALARAYRHEKRFADAARLLEQVIAVSPDRLVYEELAEMYKQQGDDDKWLAIYEKYLSTSEDFGLDHAKVNEEIAYTLMRMKKLDRALKYAKGAADSYSFWGLRVYAACLTELGRYEEAEQVERANQERYREAYAWYRWCQTTGRGDLDGARKLSEPRARQAEQSDGPAVDAAVYLQLEGQPGRARALHEKSFKQRGDPYDALQLALLDVEDGKPQVATERLEEVNFSGHAMPAGIAQLMGGITPPADDERMKIYAAVVEEMLRCLGDAGTTPRREGGVKVILDATEAPQRTCAAYFFGRLCELRNKPDDAKWWYRTAMQTREWTAVCRPQAAAGLRRLGEEYYK